MEALVIFLVAGLPLGVFWYVWFDFFPFPHLWDALFVEKTPDKCHKSQHAYGFGEYIPCTVCKKSPDNWRHWPKRLEPHKFKPHVRRDIGTAMKFCDLCNAHEGHKVHRTPLPISVQIEDLEKWHAKFRFEHPEFEDHVRNELFPELVPTRGKK